MPKLELVEKLDGLSQHERNIYCETLFLTVNWFREVLLHSYLIYKLLCYVQYVYSQGSFRLSMHLPLKMTQK